MTALARYLISNLCYKYGIISTVNLKVAREYLLLNDLPVYVNFSVFVSHRVQYTKGYFSPCFISRFTL